MLVLARVVILTETADDPREIGKTHLDPVISDFFYCRGRPRKVLRSDHFNPGGRLIFITTDKRDLRVGSVDANALHRW